MLAVRQSLRVLSSGLRCSAPSVCARSRLPSLFLVSTRCYVFPPTNAAYNFKTGLMMLAHLNGDSPHATIRDLNKTKAAVIARCDAITAEAYDPKLSATAVVDLLDEVSDQLCIACDSAEALRLLHAREDVRTAADQLYQSMQAYTNQLNVDARLYDRIRQIVDTPSLFESLSAEDQLFVKAMKIDMERYGVHLPEARRQELLDLEHRSQELQSDFYRHASQSGLTPQTQNQTLSAELLEEFAKMMQGSIDTPLDEAQTNLLLQHLADDLERQRVFLEGKSLAPENLAVLTELLSTRHKIALLLGYASFAELSMASYRLAKSPDQVRSFVETLSGRLRPVQQAEHALLLEQKRQLRFAALPQSMISAAQRSAVRLEPWDLGYLMAKCRGPKWDTAQRSLTEYLTHDNVRNGMNIVAKAFGTTIKWLSPGDDYPPQCVAWTHEGDVTLSAVHDSETDKLLGYICWDTFARYGKLHGAATFSIVGPRVLPNSSDKRVPTYVVSHSCARTHEHPLLSPHEVEEMFHEFGHALHGILNDTKRQMLGGLRCALDLSEIPSHVFERFAFHPAVLGKYAKHYRTGQAIPNSVLDDFLESRHAFSATTLSTNITWSLFDLEVHGLRPLKGTSTDIYRRVHDEHSLITLPARVHPETTFTHGISAYAAGYYSYLFAEAISGAIWNKYFAKNPLDPTEGRRFRTEFLRYGGARDPLQVLESYLGTDLHSSLQYYLDSIAKRTAASARLQEVAGSG